MSIHISQARVLQVRTIAQQLCESFTSDSDIETRQQKLLTLLHPEIRWYDHGFYNVRAGPEAILDLQTAFLYCNQPFQTEIKTIYPTEDGAAMEQIWHGVCKNDIVRPDGHVVVRGSGRKFSTHVAFFLKITENGLIVRIDEYDYRHWDEGRSESAYTEVRRSVRS